MTRVACVGVRGRGATSELTWGGCRCRVVVQVRGRRTDDQSDREWGVQVLEPSQRRLLLQPGTKDENEIKVRKWKDGGETNYGINPFSEMVWA